MPSIPQGNTPAPTPVQPPTMQQQQDALAPTAQNPLAPLNNYQAQQQSGSYNAPTFQGSASYQPGSVTAPQVQTGSYQA